MGVFYLEHAEHGCKVACSISEVKLDVLEGWKEYTVKPIDAKAIAKLEAEQAAKLSEKMLVELKAEQAVKLQEEVLTKKEIARLAKLEANKKKEEKDDLDLVFAANVEQSDNSVILEEDFNLE